MLDLLTLCAGFLLVPCCVRRPVPGVRCSISPIACRACRICVACRCLARVLSHLTRVSMGVLVLRVVMYIDSGHLGGGVVLGLQCTALLPYFEL